MSNMLSTKEAATELGVPLGTLKRWVDELPIPLEKDAAGARRYGPEALEVLRRVAELRQDDRHFESIRVIINPSQTADGPGLSPDLGAGQPANRIVTSAENTGPGPSQPAISDRAEPGPSVQEVAATVGDAIVERVGRELSEVLRRENDMAEKYARAGHRIGELEATLKARDERLELLAAELAEVKADRDQVRALLAAPPAPVRPWWKVWG